MIVRPLLIFWLIACGLWTAERAFQASQSSGYLGTLVVTSADIEQLEQAYLDRRSRPADSAETAAMLRQLLQERVLINEARRLQLDKADPVVAERISKNLEFLDQAKGSSAQWREQMVQQDPVIQRRLLERMQALLASRQAAAVDDQALARYYDAHREDYRESSRYRVELFLLKHTADEATGSGASSPTPLMLAAPAQPLSVANLAKLLPQSLLAQLLKAQPGDVFQHQGAAGTYVLTLVGAEQGAVPPLPEIRARVWSDFYRWQREQISRRYAQELLGFYRIDMPTPYRNLLSERAQQGINFADGES